MGNQSSSTLFFAIVVTYSALALHLISKAQQISLIWPSFDTKKNDFYVLELLQIPGMF